MPPSHVNAPFFAAALFLATTGAALAQNTAPNTLVTNTIDLSYSGGVGTPTVTVPGAASVEFRVDRKIDVSVETVPTGGQVASVQGRQEVVIAHLVRNLGNDTQSFVYDVQQLTAGIAGSGLSYSNTATSTLGEYYVMISPTTAVADGFVYDVGAPITGTIPVGGEFYVLIVANVPTNALDGQEDTFLVRAIATVSGGNTTPITQDRTQGLMGVNTVFADNSSVSSLSGGVIDDSLNGRAADDSRLLITAPQLSATKTVEVLDEGLPGNSFTCSTGGAATGTQLAAIPGACLEYTIVVTNDGAASNAATDIVIVDTVPDNTSFAGTTAGPFTIATSGTPVTVTATLPTLVAGNSAEFRIRVTVD